MLTVLLLTWLVLQLVSAIRSKDTVDMVIALVGAVLAVLVCLGAVALPVCLGGRLG